MALLDELLADSAAAATQLQVATTAQKNLALEYIAEDIQANAAEILSANAVDIERGIQQGMAQGLQDRLRLTPERIDGLAAAVRQVIGLPDPVGDIVRGSTLANGVRIEQVRVPFGVIGVIYEARPNVTVDVVALTLKSGNASVLRGGSAAESSNNAIVGVLQGAIERAGLPGTIVQTIDPWGREGAHELMQARGKVDLLIPRGGAGLIQAVVTESKVPVIETGEGNVHVYIDDSAEAQMAVDIAVNSKTHRPSVCNAAETLLVHRAVADSLLPQLVAALVAHSVTLHGDDTVHAMYPEIELATDQDWATEYLAAEMAVKVVDSMDEAIAHINRYSTHHTETIVTQNFARAEDFLARVNSAVVMVNASTRFTDGGEFGFGAEVGISTQKLHARGPMGLPELTSTKWLVRGQGQVRQ